MLFFVYIMYGVDPPVVVEELQVVQVVVLAEDTVIGVVAIVADGRGAFSR